MIQPLAFSVPCHLTSQHTVPSPWQLTSPQTVILLLGRQHLSVSQPAAAHNLDPKAQHGMGEEELGDGAEAGAALLLVL